MLQQAILFFKKLKIANGTCPPFPLGFSIRQWHLENALIYAKYAGFLF